MKAWVESAIGLIATGAGMFGPKWEWLGIVLLSAGVLMLLNGGARHFGLYRALGRALRKGRSSAADSPGRTDITLHEAVMRLAFPATGGIPPAGISYAEDMRTRIRAGERFVQMAADGQVSTRGRANGILVFEPIPAKWWKEAMLSPSSLFETEPEKCVPASKADGSKPWDRVRVKAQQTAR